MQKGVNKNITCASAKLFQQVSSLENWIALSFCDSELRLFELCVEFVEVTAATAATSSERLWPWIEVIDCVDSLLAGTSTLEASLLCVGIAPTAQTHKMGQSRISLIAKARTTWNMCLT